mmetsp:Transcript_11757/g.25378  ORF Transcript_11757/g.25378 Transcript_11757/m.25378 type:complete len:292 (-) Transcript_11757:168-1043(-)
MGGIIDFDTTCPWELYLFAFIHLIGAVVMYLFDSCELLTSKSCTNAELVMESFVVLSLLYVGVIFFVLTYHNKSSPAKITRLSNIALNGAIALLVSVIFSGNASYFGGIERSWMHVSDMLTMIILVAVLSARVAKSDAEWAPKNPLGDDTGVNCKTLLLLLLILTAIKIVVCTDFVDPMKMLADGLEMTDVANCMYKCTIVLILEVFLALLYAVLFDDEAGHELVVFTIMIMTAVSAGLIHSVQKYMSSWMGLSSNAIWIQVGILVLVCLIAIGGGRHGSSQRLGYQNVSN